MMDPPSFTRPLIHTLCTPDLDALLSSANFDSLASLLSPFGSSPLQSPALNNVQVRTPPNHEPRLLPHFPIEFKHRSLPSDFDAAASPGTSLAMRREGSLNGNVSQGQKDELFLDQLSTRISSSSLRSTTFPPEIHLDPTDLWPSKQQYDLEGTPLPERRSNERAGLEWESKTLDELTPWYKHFRDEVFRRRELVEYETWGCPVGCILALSTNHPDPLNALSLLWDLTSPSQLYSPASSSPSPSSHPNQQDFVNPDILRYILIIHDMRTTATDSSLTEGNISGVTSWEQVKRLEETVKKTYGVHTKVLGLWDHYQPLRLPDEIEKEGPEKSLDDELEKLWPTRGGNEGEDSVPERLVGLGYFEDDTPGTTKPTLPVGQEQSERVSYGGRRRKGQDLSLVDLQNLSVFTREFVSQSLVPFLERTVTVSNEQFNNSKKSLGGRLFSVGRKYFGSSSSTPTTGNSRSGSPVTSGAQLSYNSGKGFYPFQSQESQSRRLADLAFMLRDYKLAGTVYGEVARDFKGDRAWKFFTSAVRMQGISQLLATVAVFSSPSTPSPSMSLPPNLSGPSSPDHLLESSILPTPSPSSPSIDFDLLRSTMLYHYYYQSLPRSSTPILARLSSTALMRLVDSSIERARGGGGEEDELWSAMICEQSALARLGITNWQPLGTRRERKRYGNSRGERKFVLEMCLAGIRYEKSGLKSLSRRCLSQASSLYSLSSSPPSDPSFSFESRLTALPTFSNPTTIFSAVRTYLHHSLARQAYNASQPLDAIYHFLQLLPRKHSAPIDVTDEAGAGSEGGEGLDWLDDFTLAWDLLGAGGGQNKAEELASERGLELGVRLFDAKKVRVSRRVALGGGGGGGQTSSEAARSRYRVSAEDDWSSLESRLLEQDEGGASGSGSGKKMTRRGDQPRRLRGKLRDDQVLVGETFYLELPIHNPLEAFLSIGALTVEALAIHEGENDLQIDQSLDGEVVELAPLESRIIYIPMRGVTAGTYRFPTLSYRFHNLLPVTESLASPASRKSESSRTAIMQEDVVPTAELCRPIPVLSISTDQLAQRLLHGQIETTRLKFKNTGQIAIKGLKGTCSNSEIGFFLTKGNESLEGSVSEDDSGKKVKIDNSMRHTVTTQTLLREGETIEPGQEGEIEIAMRGDSVGEHEVKWLFCYESTSSDFDGEIFSTRIVHKLEVSPSLEFRYSTRPTDSDSPFALNLEAYNSGVPTEDLCITSISVVSPLWRASSLASTSTEDDQRPIPWQQSSNLAFAIDRVEDGLERCKSSITWSVRQIEALLQGKKVEGSKPGQVELEFSTIPCQSPVSLGSPPRSILLESLINSHSRQRLASLAVDFPTVPSHLIPSLFPLFAATASLILVEFTSVSLKATGQHFLPLPSLGASQNYLREVLSTAELKAGGLYAESQRERTALIESLRRSELGEDQDPSIVFVDVEERVIREHNFETGPCLVPIHFLIRNVSPITSFDCVLTLGTTTDSSLLYTGLLTRRCTIAPLSIWRITTQAFITREGSYNVGGWTLNVRTEEGRTWRKEGEERELTIR
ncbi:Trs85p [Sporobolomyces salmoneus]|uniref:Trs85p n=1 Tax=Sporobolomyces salmoneus TaxID=183962 RepID=UPI003172E33E